MWDAPARPVVRLSFGGGSIFVSAIVEGPKGAKRGQSASYSPVEALKKIFERKFSAFGGSRGFISSLQSLAGSQ